MRIRARARRDLADILDRSVAIHGEELAEAYLKRIDAALVLLAERPRLGEKRGEHAADLRSYPVGEHRIFHLLLPDRVSVVRVLHKRMDAAQHL